MKQRIATS